MKRHTTKAVATLAKTERVAILLVQGTEELVTAIKNFSWTGNRASIEGTPDVDLGAVVTRIPNRFALPYFTNLGQRIRAAWKRYQCRMIQRAIRTYSVEKHFRSPLYHPVVGPATMRMAMGLTDRNKWHFHVKTATIPSISTVSRIPEAVRVLHDETVIPQMSQHRLVVPTRLENQRKQCS